MACVVLLVASSLFAVKGPDGQAGTPPVPQSDKRVEALLRDWDAKKSKIRDFRCDFEITTSDPVFRSTEVQRGEASAMGADLLRIDLKGKSPDILLYDGNRLRWFSMQREWLLTLRDDTKSPAACDDTRLGFLGRLAEAMFSILGYGRFPFYGISASEANRFTVRLEKEVND
jgi:hypothetical protein